MSHLYLSDNARWKAVSSRDSAASTHFVYCVRTTLIYCRPDCSSRLARRANIEFADSAAEAVDRGYKACRRCRPDLPLHEPQRDVVVKACQRIEQAAREDEVLGLEDLANGAGLTKSHFHRVFKRVIGLTPAGYRREVEHRSSRLVSEGQGCKVPVVTVMTPTVMSTMIDTGELDLSAWIIG